jgi:hypothetical protein
MGKRIDKTKIYNDLQPEELHNHVRKNVSIPKYMDSFIYKHNISLSKLVQNAITQRMKKEQELVIKNDMENQIDEKIFKKKYNEEKKKNPNFDFDLQRAKNILSQYFIAFDSNDNINQDLQKQSMLSDFPEMYVDVIKFEKWEKLNEDIYLQTKQKYENPVERLVYIKNKFIRK